MKEALQKAATLVDQAQSVVVLSGAGMSAESGVPTFRDAQTGLWERFVPEQLATEEAFRANPSLVWSWYMWRWMLISNVTPHVGHTAIGVWQQKLTAVGGSLTVATQNVDDLHERGGAHDVVHLHGSLHKFRCLDCDQPAAFDPLTTGISLDQEFDEHHLLPTVNCDSCARGVLRPGVVWFGERLPEGAFEAAMVALQQAELVVVVGSSGLVQPAAALPYVGSSSGAKIIEINPVATELSQTADVYLASTAAVALPQLVSRVR